MMPQQLCRKILDIHEAIRWVKVIDHKGQIASEDKRNHVEPYLSQNAMENLRLLWIETIRGIVEKAAQYWGPPQHLHIQFGKVVVLGFPHLAGAVVIVAEPYVPLTVIGQIQEVLRESSRSIV